jgi:hypothetical protein
MNRNRAIWVAAVTAVLLAAGYLLMMRRRSGPAAGPAGLPFTAPPHPITPPAPPIDVAAPEPTTSELAAEAPEQPPAVKPTPAVEPKPVRAPIEVEAPLPGWARAAIIVAALLAFFAVSLIATKNV